MSKGEIKTYWIVFNEREQLYLGELVENEIGWGADTREALRFADRETAERVIRCEGGAHLKALEFEKHG